MKVYIVLIEGRVGCVLKSEETAIKLINALSFIEPIIQEHEVIE